MELVKIRPGQLKWTSGRDWLVIISWIKGTLPLEVTVLRVGRLVITLENQIALNLGKRTEDWRYGKVQIKEQLSEHLKNRREWKQMSRDAEFVVAGGFLFYFLCLSIVYM